MDLGEGTLSYRVGTIRLVRLDPKDEDDEVEVVGIEGSNFGAWTEKKDRFSKLKK